MKKLICFVILALAIQTAEAQKLTEQELIGVWTTEKLVKKPSNPNYRDITDSYKASVFTFDAEHIFDLKSDQNSQEFAATRKMTKQKNWKFDEVNQIIKIGDAKDNFSTMKIKVKRIDGKIVFVLEESQHSLELEMKKYEPKKSE